MFVVRIWGIFGIWGISGGTSTGIKFLAETMGRRRQSNQRTEPGPSRPGITRVD